MHFTKFHIQNYKGIRDTTIDLSLKPDFKIYSLIGLNESGKTTILEAINDCIRPVPADRRYELIPKGEAGGFTGSTIIEACIEISDEDRDAIKAYVTNDLRVKYEKLEIPSEFTLTRTYKYENAEAKGSTYITTPYIVIRRLGEGKGLNALPPAKKNKLWSFVNNNLLPEIVFYKDFLSKFPEKVYLQPSALDSKAKEYLNIIEDVLTSINPRYNVESSLLKRLAEKNNQNLQALEAVENQLGAKISQIVFEAWNKIQKVSKKEIVVKADADSDGKFFLKFTVKDGLQSYSISERSLGFQWFFTYLLYTEIRKERAKSSGEILFLLDEPASNLHQAAQKSLLETFEKIVTKSRLIYTTHSHHLINPAWLDNAYIVKNNGLNYVEDDNFTVVNTEIEATKYKVFASSHPDQTSYFQPILDVLDYKPGLLEHVPKIVITEGKFDFATLLYFKDVVLKKSRSNFSFYPGQGATKLDLPISLYEAWSRKYIVILDDDREGQKEKKRYIKDLSDENKVFTLKDIDSKFAGLCMEDLFTENEKLMFSREFNASLKKYEKSAFNTGIRMVYAEKRIPSYITKNTIDKMSQIVDFSEIHLA